MKLIFEENIENTDFLELILDEKEASIFPFEGIVDEFSGGLFGDRNLNIFIRIGGKHATRERISRQIKKRVLRKCP
jgi:hypothetical protein